MTDAITKLEIVLLNAGRLVASGKPGALVRLYRPALNDYARLRLQQGDTPTQIVAKVRALYTASVKAAQPGNYSPLTVRQMWDFIRREVYQYECPIR